MSIFLLIFIAIMLVAIFVRLGQILVKISPDHFVWSGSAKPISSNGPIKKVFGANFVPSQSADKKRGAIIMPKTDLEEAREQKIAENMAEGRDTPLSELE